MNLSRPGSCRIDNIRVEFEGSDVRYHIGLNGELEIDVRLFRRRGWVALTKVAPIQITLIDGATPPLGAQTDLIRT